MDAFDQGLRCQDVHSGVRNLDPNSPILTPLLDTRLVGMSASLAGLIRGRDVVDDAQALRAVAAAQLDVDQFAFNDVISVLESAGFVRDVDRQAGRITRFFENVPYYDDLYVRLGEAWEARHPTELEQQMVTVVDSLARSPVPRDVIVDQLGLDATDAPRLLDVGTRSDLIKILKTPDGEVLYSPFFGFENPEHLATLVESHGSDQLAEEFARVRGYQGLPVMPDEHPLLVDAVGRGLVMAPAVELPDGSTQPFAALPYVPDHRLLTAEKPVLEKALAVLACLRCAEHFGGYSNLSPAGAVAAIHKLLDPNRGYLMPHSSSERQYQLMYNAGIVAFGEDFKPGGSWVVPRFLDTADNRRALEVARDLIEHGEVVGGRAGDQEARMLLGTNAQFYAPMQTVNRTRDKVKDDPKHWRKVFEVAMGHRAL